MWRLDRFFCCLNLDTGVILVGFINLECAAIAALFLSGMLVTCLSIDCESSGYKHNILTKRICDFGYNASILVLVIAIVISVTFIKTSYSVICGVKTVRMDNFMKAKALNCAFSSIAGNWKNQSCCLALLLLQFPLTFCGIFTLSCFL